MRNLGIVTISILSILFIAIVGAQAKTTTVSVTVNQILKDKGGVVKIGLYDSLGFAVIGEEIFGVDLEVKEASITYVFKDVSAGKYAIASFQDKNIDNELNTNLFGIPVEPYGFSHNKYGFFAPPSFEDVSFEVIENEPISFIINLE